LCPLVEINFANLIRKSAQTQKKKKEKGKESEKFDLIGHSTKLNPYYFDERSF